MNQGNVIYDDRFLLQSLVQGDQQAFTRIYDRYAGQMNLFILKFVKSQHLAEDLTQEVFIKLWEGRAQLSEVNSLRAYLFTMARNHTLNALKRFATEEAALSEIIRSYRHDHGSSYDIIQYKEYQQKVQEVLSRLPAASRIVFRLVRQEGMNYAEAASLLNVSRSAVKKHVVRSHKAFKEFFAKEFGVTVLWIGLLFSFH